ncbi:hypothetical protein GCM10025867_48560 (plasmid) [Frondihabitans sucicola]|uniref:Uncharacterized protein n=1 Tax=Frondihabitans sucicola TaxID=1268041 RepID=A0ABM8GVX0_9MICO|nr:hypothetical protein [Frondihabitans sucicola]BDZ52615.1 hypothetical protein GCM10025867_48560 [Frondihabitans sucicola]
MYYRRPKTRLQTLDSERVPEILTNVDKATVSGVGDHQRVATHELAHRFQYTVPGIHEMEQKFIVRRTTLADGTREKPVNVSGGTSREIGYADSFPDAYMGRDYSYGRADKSDPGTEILSVGMESLFTGTQGGFVGAGRYNRDDECRSFILGILASAGRKA